MTNKTIKEGLADLADMAERDHEVQMARSDLYKIAKYAIKLHEMLKNVSEADGIEGWQQAKITKAADYISSVFHALDYDMKFESVKVPESRVEKKYKPTLTNEQLKSYKGTLSAKLQEKAVSTSQQQAAGIALKHKREGTKPPAGSASESMMSMSIAELEKIAGTRHKGLPDHVNESTCPDCNNPSWRSLGLTESELEAWYLKEEKQKGVDGKACWKGYRRMGTKKKGGKTVDNCVKVG